MLHTPIGGRLGHMHVSSKLDEISGKLDQLHLTFEYIPSILESATKPVSSYVTITSYRVSSIDKTLKEESRVHSQSLIVQPLSLLGMNGRAINGELSPAHGFIVWRNSIRVRWPTRMGRSGR